MFGFRGIFFTSPKSKVNVMAIRKVKCKPECVCGDRPDNMGKNDGDGQSRQGAKGLKVFLDFFLEVNASLI